MVVLYMGPTEKVCAQDEYNTVIKWDKWGVPHINGHTDKDVFYGLGWAQMKAHGNLILKSFIKARGISAAHWQGEQYVQNDILVHKLNIPNRSNEWYDLQDKDTKAIIEGFVAGMNAYCLKFPNSIDEKLKAVLPILPTDPFSKLQISYHLKVGGFALQPQAEDWKTAGSNAWAIAPQKSQSGNSLLLIQPHPPWVDDFLFFEAHLISSNLNFYGVGFPGSPTMAMGFNEYLGWALTFNQADAMDLVELEIKDDHYKTKDGWEPLITKSFKIKVEGKQAPETFEMKQTKFGYIVDEKEGKALALRLSGLNRPFFDKQFIKMAKARNLEQFENAMRMQQLPLQNIIYADKEGEIYYLYNGIIPKRPSGDLKEWYKIQPSTKPGSQVREYVPFEDLPVIKNPKSGFVYNSNNNPWSSTYPFAIEPKNYPTYIAPKIDENFDFRSARSLRMLLSKPKLSFADLEKMQSSTYSELADRTIDELVYFGKNSNSNLLRNAAEILEKWDRKLESKSKGAVLFADWYYKTDNHEVFRIPFDPSQPLRTPNTLELGAKEKLIDAAEDVMAKYGRLDVPWGDVYQTDYADKSLKGGLGLSELGSFNAGFYGPKSDDTFTLLGGSAFTSIIEFGKKIKAKGLLSYGNASQPESPFRGDQLKLLVERKLRPIWFYQDELDKNIYHIEILVGKK